ncbi:MAG: hypothetical protein LBN24_09380 [Mediterranea sp.]|nr:hypothetical protein [Mediterranea sp.]
MKKVQRYVGALMLLALAVVGFSACESDETIEERLFGRVWSGSIGELDDNNVPLFSDFQFTPDGFGTEDVYYPDGSWYDSYTFQWYWEDGYSNNLVLDFRRLGVSYMDNVYVGGRAMTGTYYYTNDSPGVPFRLQMR